MVAYVKPITDQFMILSFHVLGLFNANGPNTFIITGNETYVMVGVIKDITAQICTANGCCPNHGIAGVNTLGMKYACMKRVVGYTAEAITIAILQRGGGGEFSCCWAVDDVAA